MGNWKAHYMRLEAKRFISGQGSFDKIFLDLWSLSPNFVWQTNTGTPCIQLPPKNCWYNLLQTKGCLQNIGSNKWLLSEFGVEPELVIRIMDKQKDCLENIAFSKRQSSHCFLSDFKRRCFSKKWSQTAVSRNYLFDWILQNIYL